MSVDIRRETEELVRYYGELVRRLGQSGVRDVADLLALYERLGRALETVSRQEIGWVTEQVQRLIEALVRMDSNLDALRRLKKVLSPRPRAAWSPRRDRGDRARPQEPCSPGERTCVFPAACTLLPLGGRTP